MKEFARRPLFRSLVFTATLLAAIAPRAAAQSAANVAVVVNGASPVSREIADYYMKRRGIPAENRVTITTATGDTIDRDSYVRTIETPIATWLAHDRLQDRILYLVLTKGVPLAIEGTGGRDGTRASVDSELTLLYRRMVGVPVQLRGSIANPFFRERATSERVFSRADYDVFLVTRLDGFTVEDVRGLIDRATAPQTTGVFLLDQKGDASLPADRWLAAASEALGRLLSPERVRLTTESTGVADRLLGYVSWGSNDPALRVRVPPLQFAAGALATTFVGSGARTFTEPPPGWQPGGAVAPAYAGTQDSLIGDLIRAGVTGAAGNVSEPFVDGSVRPDALLPSYVSGRDLAQAFYSAIPSLSWQTVVVGDPLCRPFAKDAAPAAADAPIDPATELPEQFSRRRMAAFAAIVPDVPASAVALFVRSQAREARGEHAAAIESAQQALAAVPTFAAARRYLATLYQQSGDKAAAERSYRELLAASPNDVVVLNNLAYLLGERGAFDEAGALASRAFSIAPRSAAVVDTLGWIEHLRGNDTEARQLLARAIALDPHDAEMRVHAATVFAPVDPVRARQELEAALRQAPEIADRPDVVALKKNLGLRDREQTEVSPQADSSR